jgi:hypothetical protein
MEGTSREQYLPVFEARGPDDETSVKSSEEELFSFEVITLEEMAIDGICGVY